jgi:hypothetical protein
MNWKKILRLFQISLGGIFLFSCSVSQQITLNPDGSGQVESSVFMEDFFLTTLKDLTDLGQAGEGGKSPLEADTIAGELTLNPYFDDVRVSSPAEGEYRGELSFRHIEELFAVSGRNSNPVIRHEELENGQRRLVLRVDDDNFQQIFQLFPVLKDPGFQYFLPEPDISREEYEEMLLFIFEDGASEALLKSLIRQASLDLIIRVNGRITDQQGGRKLNPDTLKIRIPLLDLLLHEEELIYSLTYQSR